MEKKNSLSFVKEKKGKKNHILFRFCGGTDRWNSLTHMHMGRFRMLSWRWFCKNLCFSMLIDVCTCCYHSQNLCFGVSMMKPLLILCWYRQWKMFSVSLNYPRVRAEKKSSLVISKRSFLLCFAIFMSIYISPPSLFPLCSLKSQKCWVNDRKRPWEGKSSWESKKLWHFINETKTILHAIVSETQNSSYTHSCDTSQTTKRNFLKHRREKEFFF